MFTNTTCTTYTLNTENNCEIEIPYASNTYNETIFPKLMKQIIGMNKEDSNKYLSENFKDKVRINYVDNFRGEQQYILNSCEILMKNGKVVAGKWA